MLEVSSTHYSTITWALIKLENIEQLHNVSVGAARYINEINKRDEMKTHASMERLNKEYEESDMKLNKLNNRLQTVNNRLQESFRKRIESLNSQNAKTEQIRRRMTKFEQEQKEKHFHDYLAKQMEYAKRLKKLNKYVAG